MEKECFKCRKVKKITEFYVHKQTNDKHLGKCKSCTKLDAKTRYYEPEARKRIIEYERLRFKTEERKTNIYLYRFAAIEKNPGKFRARYKVNNAVRDGRLIKSVCEKCGDKKTQAHHTDYRRPLQVMWLCRKHHLEVEGKVVF